MDEMRTQENCKQLGTYFMLELAKLRDKYEIVGDVRGKGLMIGMEMVTDKESRTPLPAEKMNNIWERIKNYGVIIGKGGLYQNVSKVNKIMILKSSYLSHPLNSKYE